MKFLITGGTGFIGSNLIKFLQKNSCDITVLTRQKLISTEKITFVNSFKQLDNSKYFDVIVNLAGAPIDKRWTESYKKILIDSRVNTTNNLIELMDKIEQKPKLFISASAVGYYGLQNAQDLDEESNFVNSFSHELCDIWEKNALTAENKGVRTCIIRLGVVLGKNCNMLSQILPLFRLCLGGKVGSGKQFFSWVHIDDVIRCFDYLINNVNASGIYNLTAPTRVTNSEFTNILGKLLNKPVFFNIPDFMIKLVFGSMGEELLLNGSYIKPQKLLSENFKFNFDDLNVALSNILNK